MSKEQKPPSSEVEFQRRVRRLERICLILCITVLLIGISGIRLAGTVGKIVGIFELITEQLDLISQKVDAVRQGVQSIK